MDKKTLYLSIFGLIIVLVGCIAVCLMGFPAGLFIIIPTGIPHVVNLYRWRKQNKKIQIILTALL